MHVAGLAIARDGFVWVGRRGSARSRVLRLMFERGDFSECSVV